MSGRSEPRTNWKKSGGRRYPSSGEKGKVAIRNIEENMSRTEVF